MEPSARAPLAIRALQPREVYVLCTRSRVAIAALIPPAPVGVGIVKHLKRALACPPKTLISYHNAIHCY